MICCFTLMFGLFSSNINQKDINQYENRVSYKIPKIELKGFTNKTFQDQIELAFADQLPMAIPMKKVYNYIQSFSTDLIIKLFLKNKCSNLYLNINDKISTFGCDRHLVYKQTLLKNDKEEYKKRVENINNFIKNIDEKTYLYYIEKDTDINFIDNEKSGIYKYLKNNINLKNINRFKVNNFEEYKKYFYKTDHHWNYKGSYLAYTELVNILTNDKPLKVKNEVCINNNFSGSKASIGGISSLYKEEFCAYEFDFPKFNIYINGIKGDYGKEEYYFSNNNEFISYALFYGDDHAEIIFESNEPEKENILIIGESFDNAILKLLATHFNKTYSIDLRHYEKQFGRKFKYSDYVLDKNIDKVLLIGNKDYFLLEEFYLEV